jgi:aspartyl-tRNA(Asn)/glutamyl-tRNA(Gln) amidotransferase subunit A
VTLSTATELLAAYRARERSPVEVAEGCLAAIERQDGEIAAFCHTDPDSTLAATRKSGARWRRGTPAGLLDGVPVAVKDVFLTFGWPTLRGFPMAPPRSSWDVDAPAVAALRRHGAVLVGKTSTPQLGWKGVTDAPERRPTRNPWDPARTAGGSSGGSAAALALGMATLALGTDGGGSIRIPGAFCGVTGLKPTFARVPQWPPSPFGLLSHAGPMALTVADTALLLDVLAQPDARDWGSLPAPTARYATGLQGGIQGMRIAYSRDLGYVDVDPEVAAAVEEAARILDTLGAVVEQVDPGFTDPREAFDVLWSAAAAAAVGRLHESQRQVLDPGLAAIAERGAALSACDWLDADERRTALGALMGGFHARWDLLITPTLPIVAFAAGQEAPEDRGDRHWVGWTPFTYPFNLTQQPAATVPCGRTEAGLPIGLQIVGPRHAEAAVLRAAYAYEAAAPAPADGAAA